MKKQNLFGSKKKRYMAFTLLFSFLIMSFSFDENSYQWWWKGQVYIPIVFGIIAVIMGRLWFIEYRKEIANPKS